MLHVFVTRSPRTGLRQPMPRKQQSPRRPKPSRAENQTIWENLAPLEQVPRVHLLCDVGEVVAPAVGRDHAAARLERLEVVRDLGTEEVGRVQRGLNRRAPFAATLMIDSNQLALDDWTCDSNLL